MNSNSITTSSVVAKKYAQAFVSIYSSILSREILHHFSTLSDFLKRNSHALLLLSLPHVTEEQHKTMIHTLISRFSLPSECTSLFMLLLRHHRIMLLPIVLSYITHIYRKNINIIHFLIHSSHPLHPTYLEDIQKFLAAQTGKKITYSHIINRNLIAGIRMSSDEYVWEYSVSKHIKALLQHTIR